MIQGTSYQLRRVMGLPHATAMVVGTIIGASIFVQPSEISRLVHSVPAVLGAWLVAGILTLFGSLVCAELASMFSVSGGVYLYLKEAYSPAIGFLWGWAMFWVMHSGIIAAVAVVFARYVSYFIPLSLYSIKMVGVLVILLLSLVNYLGVKQGSSLQALLTLGKVVAIALLILVGFLVGSSLPEHFMVARPLDTPNAIGGFLLAVAAGLFAFGGWHMVTYNSEETLHPRRTIPRALVLGTSIVLACYIAMNAVYLYVLPLEQVSSSPRIAADLADALMGSGGGSVMASLVIFSTFGALSGIILAGPRVYLAMARDGLLFDWLGQIHARYRTPHKGIVLQAGWSSLLVWTDTYRTLFSRVVYTEWIFFGLMTIGLFLLRRRSDLSRGYSVWGYPLVPAVFIVASFVIAGRQIVADPVDSLMGLSLVAVGLPTYYLWTRKPRNRGGAQ
ncbi:MAG: APC family permease [Acidobacteriota bacterium]